MKRRRRTLSWGLWSVLAAWLALWAAPVAGATGWSQPVDIGNWSDPGEMLEGGGLSHFTLIEFQFPRLAVSPNGMAVAVWEDMSLPAGVFAAVRPSGETSWQPPVRIAAHGRNPAVAVNARGAVVVVWQGRAGTPLESAFLPSHSDRWDAPVALPGVQEAAIPRVAIDSRGNAVAAWVDMPAALREPGPEESSVRGFLQSAVRDARSGLWSQPVSLTKVNRDSIETVVNDSFAIAMDANGDAVMEWVQAQRRQRERGPAVIAVTVDSRVRSARSHRWLATERIAPLRDDANPLSVSLALAPSGAAFVAWEVALDRTSTQPYLDRSLIRGAIHVPWQRSWGPVETVSGAMAREPGAPAIAIDSRGTATAVWSTGVEDGEGDIEGSTRATPSGRWAPFGVVGHGNSPRLAAGGRGDLATTWESGFHNGAELLQAAVRPVRGAWQAPKLISPTNRRSARPAVALDSSGEAFVIAWERGGVVAATSYR